jgi:hypothetical protein
MNCPRLEEPGLYEFLCRMSLVDLVLVEGYKLDPTWKSKPIARRTESPCFIQMTKPIAALASDTTEGLPLYLPHRGLDTIQAIAGLILLISS